MVRPVQDELDIVIASFGRLNKAISKYLRAQYAIEARLEQAFAAGGTLQRKETSRKKTTKP